MALLLLFAPLSYHRTGARSRHPLHLSSTASGTSPELVGNQRTLPRTKLLQQLKKHRGRAAFRGEEERRARLVAELQQARLTGVRFKVPAETMSAKLANLPEGVSVARGRIEVRFDGAENALARLFALAQALGNDYVRFEELVGR